MKILVVDDSTVIRKIIRKELERGGYEIEEAFDGIDALEKVKKLQPDLITLDVDMPRLNGYNTCDRLRKMQENNNKRDDKIGKIPVIFITARDTVEGRTKGFQAGASDFCVKPFIAGEVLGKVNKILKPEKSWQGLNALVAEDSKLSRQIIVRALTEMGISVFEAANGVEGFKIMTESTNQIDLVITDYMMPLMNGDELCSKIRTELGMTQLPIIFLSGMSEKSFILDMFRAGASDYLIKPFAKEELIARVKVHLNSQLLNKELNENIIQLKRLDKLKDKFLAIASHDLRAPLSGILGFADILLEESYIKEEDKESLENIRSSGEFLLSLINDILDLSRIQSETEELEFKEVSLYKKLKSSLVNLQHMATPKGITLEIDKGISDEGVILGDANSITRIFNNLISNAIKFTPPKGKISVSLEHNNSNYSVSVIDTGVGISTEKLPKIFDTFSKTSVSGTAGEKGTGLGLSITKNLVEQHSGTINVTSKLGKGSCFRVSFPAKPDKKDTQDSIEVIGSQGTGDSTVPSSKTLENDYLNILLVEDNPLNIKLVTTVLSKRGHKVVFAENGDRAVKKVCKSSLYFKAGDSGNLFDLILMDLHMPIMNGIEATRKIRKFQKDNNQRRIPIIAMTANCQEQEKENCLNAGMDDYITKPVNILELEKIARQIISSEK